MHLPAPGPRRDPGRCLRHGRNRVVAAQVYPVLCRTGKPRCGHLAGCTASPTRAWVPQHARPVRWRIQAGAVPARCLIPDRDTTLPAACDTVFTAKEVTIICTPAQASHANAYAKRWLRSVPAAWLDKRLIRGARQLHRVLPTSVAEDTHARPHSALRQPGPVPCGRGARDGPLERRAILGQTSVFWRIGRAPPGCYTRTIPRLSSKGGMEVFGAWMRSERMT